jgi:microsomal dipeptidase-like Zn-dependent dipeptidase
MIERLNANRIIVDVTHTGYRTTMEAMEISTRIRPASRSRR